ncbi:MAG: cell division protein FtsL [Pelagibacteraceae bacterium BACL5 MAG-120705-bin12]|nr:MAG: cell division protein FtsL [Pelagibacteraceae bacterium BACL5 MAG-121015-bin10]KRO60013.1 MAG: cell division protein FtsL [Pelagibacteraceae bacterium BACL5 MAG-120705-bin12]KRO64859.1 MAG: cell division protein FtsL [Pelagibacteraceae bacterium BACL5 MAG-120820-bin39]
MKKFWLLFIIFFLIISTSIIKNSTKKIEDETFFVEENLRVLNLNYNDVLLEHNYLSSSERLLEYQSLYFDNELNQKNIKEIKMLIKKDNKILIKDLEITK